MNEAKPKDGWNEARPAAPDDKERPTHPETDRCGFDRNASITEDCYVCACGFVDRAVPNPSPDRNSANNFCRTCGCHFPPDVSELACRAWEECCEAQEPQSARAAVIEECAQIADAHIPENGAENALIRSIVNEIRALDNRDDHGKA